MQEEVKVGYTNNDSKLHRSYQIHNKVLSAVRTSGYYTSNTVFHYGEVSHSFDDYIIL